MLWRIVGWPENIFIAHLFTYSLPINSELFCNCCNAHPFLPHLYYHHPHLITVDNPPPSFTRRWGILNRRKWGKINRLLHSFQDGSHVDLCDESCILYCSIFYIDSFWIKLSLKFVPYHSIPSRFDSLSRKNHIVFESGSLSG